MTGAELKTRREAMGLTVQWLAADRGVEERTLRYWESDKEGKGRVPADVYARIVQLETLQARLVDQALAVILPAIEQAGQIPEEPVVLTRYRTEDDLWRYRPDMKGLPATFHAAALNLIRRALAGLTIPCALRYFDVDAYEIWRAEHRLPDSDRVRGAFSAGAERLPDGALDRLRRST